MTLADLSTNLLSLYALRASLMEATRAQGVNPDGYSLEGLYELWKQFKLIAYVSQHPQIIPDDHDIICEPSAGYDVLSAVEIPVAYNLKPWNIREGVTIFGITGTLVMEDQADAVVPYADEMKEGSS